jgi:hypothetical protein
MFKLKCSAAAHTTAHGQPSQNNTSSEQPPNKTPVYQPSLLKSSHASSKPNT